MTTPRIKIGECFAMCGGAVVKLAADGDPKRLRRLACRFSAPMYPGNDLDVTVFDAGASSEGERAFAFEATAGDATVIKHGRARWSPPDPPAHRASWTTPSTTSTRPSTADG